MKIFKNRQAAGKLLAQRLRHFSSDRGIIVLGIPRGGVVVAYEISKQLNLPLDVIITRKIGAPNQKELALGAIDADGEVVWDEKRVLELEVKSEQVKEIIREELDELERREKAYRKGKKPLEVEGKTIILVDDGIATGSTTLAAINYLKRHKSKKIILAVPVSSKDSLEKIKSEVDEVVVLEIPDEFSAVGQFYQEFPPVEDEEVISLLNYE